jgi:hypothetical protein
VQSDCNNDPRGAELPATHLPAAHLASHAARTDEGGGHDHGSGWLDRVGIGVSITCAVHCVAVTMLAAAPTFAASLLPDLGEGLEWVERMLLWSALVIGLFALVLPYLREHRRPLPLVLFVLGVVVLAAAQSLGVGAPETAGTVGGVSLVASAHFLNLRARMGAHDHAH